MKERIVLTSPNGNQFSALWSENTFSKSKNVGRYSPPKIDGEVLQDNGLNAVSIPTFDIIFQGSTFEADAKAFWSATNENGLWEIDHPVEGKLKRQQLMAVSKLVSVKELNIRTFSVSFDESLENRFLILRQAANLVADAFASLLDDTMKAGFVEDAFDDSASLSTELAKVAETVIEGVRTKLSPVYSVDQDSITEVENNIDRLELTISDAVIDTTDYSDNLVSLIVSTGTEGLTAAELVSTYGAFITDSISDGDNTGVNASLANELVVISGFLAFCQVVQNTDIQTQAETLRVCQDIIDLYNQVLALLDEQQETFASDTLEDSYFAIYKTYPDFQRYVLATVEYLKAKSFDLRTEKRFTIEADIATQNVVYQEYGTFGDEYENFDLFIDSNDLCCEEIFGLLKAGREVVVYVL